MTTTFTAKMEATEFMRISQAFRDKGQPLVEAYANAETVHEAFFRQTRYKNFEAFKAEYYRNHPAKV